MSQENPEVERFMNSMIKNRPDATMRTTPGPNEQQSNNPPGPPMARPRYPDIGMTRGQPQFREAINLDHEQADPFNEDRDRSARKKRREMKGPSDFDDILAGLKTKKINLKGQEDNKSVISVESIKELGQGKKGRVRKSASNSVTMSLNGLI